MFGGRQWCSKGGLESIQSPRVRTMCHVCDSQLLHQHILCLDSLIGGLVFKSQPPSST
jgi:hypothetical protein